MTNTQKIFWVGIIAILAIIFIPHLAIWALNTLFTLSIEHSTLNWFATFILIVIFGASSKSSS